MINASEGGVSQFIKSWHPNWFLRILWSETPMYHCSIGCYLKWLDFLQPYTSDDWRQDIALAATHGIDGFALNIGFEDWQRDRVADCLETSLDSGYTFKFFLSFDMSTMPAREYQDLALPMSYIENFGRHPNMLTINNKLVLSTFAGQDASFGYDTFEKAWEVAKVTFESIVPIHFIPSLFVAPSLYPSFRFLDGAFNWNGSWPIHLSNQSSREDILNAVKSLRTDDHHIAHLQRDMGQTFMAAVSPWFFTHYGVNSWNKNWLYRCDDHLYAERWEQLIANRDNVDIVQIISWNDYGESHYISTIRGAQPNSQAWVDGFPHTVFRKLTAFYAPVFRCGRYPPLTKDELFVWARPHPKNAQCTDPEEERNLGRPRGWELVEDRCWVLVFSSQVTPTSIVFESWVPCDQQRRTLCDRKECSIAYGISKLSFPLTPDTGIKVSLVRQGTVILEIAPSEDEYYFAAHPRVYNFNAWTSYASTT